MTKSQNIFFIPLFSKVKGERYAIKKFKIKTCCTYDPCDGVRVNSNLKEKYFF